ncbi:hypothetical protein ERO13_D01G105750v2 [Gossypium hirsutum]|uniref:Uncharacterized protein n=1 Tax=Gossypium darwinii TaxID=34276 RepID=A0A5D2DPP3_GOSDA|nr:hypothetical protein ERO13_D01G105750v2 [Gossypium hirsutum]TYG83045.1 hypothetical protein ES288_D01G137300v1 [Gossypium darwinii]
MKLYAHGLLGGLVMLPFRPHGRRTWHKNIGSNCRALGAVHGAIQADLGVFQSF